MIIVYVDDLLTAEKDRDINNIIEELKKEYEVKNLGQVNYYWVINMETTTAKNLTLDKNK